MSSNDSTPVARSRKPLPFVYQFTAGAIAGVTELLCLYPLGPSRPLDLSPPESRLLPLLIILPPTPSPSPLVPLRLLQPLSRAIAGVYQMWSVCATRCPKVSLSCVSAKPPFCSPFAVCPPGGHAQVKTRMQLQVGKPVAGAEHYNGMVDCFKKIIACEGAGRLYRGLVPPLMLEAPKRAVKFAANDFWGNTYKSALGTDKMTQGLSILTGCSAGATESVVVVPFELVKIRLQDKNSTYKGPMDVVGQIVRKEGLLGLYAGLEPTFWRHVTWNGGYFGCIFQVRALMPKAENKSGELFNNFLSGAIGGFVGTAFNTPFDVVKSRVQNSIKVPRLTPNYNWTLPSLLLIAREEGIGALYSGFVPKVLRLAPGGGVLLLVVEFTLNMFRKQLGGPYL